MKTLLSVALILVCPTVEAIAQSTLTGYVAVARRSGQRYAELPSETLSSIGQAYEFQKRLSDTEQQWFGPKVGWKVGYASTAAQQQFGVDSPARGPLFLSQQVQSGSTIPADDFVEIMLETEVAFTLGKTINAPVKDVAELKSYVRFVHPAFDGSDYRFEADAAPTPVDMIATDLGSHRFVLGPGVDPSKVDVDNLRLKLIRNGETLRESPSSEVMGSPWNSLLWCVNSDLELQRRYRSSQPQNGIPAGTVILTGTADKAYKVTGDAIRGEYVADCGELGQARMTIE
ncbi:2-keto-4-pentenoate hydratase [Pirellulimonas nuda]|uniref:2-keto-4-pentenoate hydratase n=1 Tax=Pirellulimonas nuda TaxID=2528009 RepID=A0A518D894_9BACT|nr:fumarylacetoacetate hydrolase family protein [Pirellulimonas nuda]QDU87675.1 2-keto-4-pentenoate hydratase [Pirellulimonas nuda]